MTTLAGNSLPPLQPPPTSAYQPGSRSSAVPTPTVRSPLVAKVSTARHVSPRFFYFQSLNYPDKVTLFLLVPDTSLTASLPFLRTHPHFRPWEGPFLQVTTPSPPPTSFPLWPLNKPTTSYLSPPPHRPLIHTKNYKFFK